MRTQYLPQIPIPGGSIYIYGLSFISNLFFYLFFLKSMFENIPEHFKIHSSIYQSLSLIESSNVTKSEALVIVGGVVALFRISRGIWMMNWVFSPANKHPKVMKALYWLMIIDLRILHRFYLLFGVTVFISGNSTLYPIIIMAHLLGSLMELFLEHLLTHEYTFPRKDLLCSSNLHRRLIEHMGPLLVVILHSLEKKLDLGIYGVSALGVSFISVLLAWRDLANEDNMRNPIFRYLSSILHIFVLFEAALGAFCYFFRDFKYFNPDMLIIVCFWPCMRIVYKFISYSMERLLNSNCNYLKIEQNLLHYFEVIPEFFVKSLKWGYANYQNLIELHFINHIVSCRNPLCNCFMLRERKDNYYESLLKALEQNQRMDQGLDYTNISAFFFGDHTAHLTAKEQIGANTNDFIEATCINIHSKKLSSIIGSMFHSGVNRILHENCFRLCSLYLAYIIDILDSPISTLVQIASFRHLFVNGVEKIVISNYILKARYILKLKGSLQHYKFTSVKLRHIHMYFKEIESTRALLSSILNEKVVLFTELEQNQINIKEVIRSSKEIRGLEEKAHSELSRLYFTNKENKRLIRLYMFFEKKIACYPKMQPQDYTAMFEVLQENIKIKEERCCESLNDHRKLNKYKESNMTLFTSIEKNNYIIKHCSSNVPGFMKLKYSDIIGSHINGMMTKEVADVHERYMRKYLLKAEQNVGKVKKQLLFVRIGDGTLKVVHSIVQIEYTLYDGVYIGALLWEDELNDSRLLLVDSIGNIDMANHKAEQYFGKAALTKENSLFNAIPQTIKYFHPEIINDISLKDLSKKKRVEYERKDKTHRYDKEIGYEESVSIFECFVFKFFTDPLKSKNSMKYSSGSKANFVIESPQITNKRKAKRSSTFKGEFQMVINNVFSKNQRYLLRNSVKIYKAYASFYTFNYTRSHKFMLISISDSRRVSKKTHNFFTVGAKSLASNIGDLMLISPKDLYNLYKIMKLEELIHEISYSNACSPSSSNPKNLDECTKKESIVEDEKELEDEEDSNSSSVRFVNKEYAEVREVPSIRPNTNRFVKDRMLKPNKLTLGFENFENQPFIDLNEYRENTNLQKLRTISFVPDLKSGDSSEESQERETVPKRVSTISSTAKIVSFNKEGSLPSDLNNYLKLPTVVEDSFVPKSLFSGFNPRQNSQSRGPDGAYVELKNMDNSHPVNMLSSMIPTGLATGMFSTLLNLKDTKLKPNPSSQDLDKFRDSELDLNLFGAALIQGVPNLQSQVKKFKDMRTRLIREISFGPLIDSMKNILRTASFLEDTQKLTFAPNTDKKDVEDVKIEEPQESQSDDHQIEKISEKFLLQSTQVRHASQASVAAELIKTTRSNEIENVVLNRIEILKTSKYYWISIISSILFLIFSTACRFMVWSFIRKGFANYKLIENCDRLLEPLTYNYKTQLFVDIAYRLKLMNHTDIINISIPKLNEYIIAMKYILLKNMNDGKEFQEELTLNNFHLEINGIDNHFSLIYAYGSTLNRFEELKKELELSKSPISTPDIYLIDSTIQFIRYSISNLRISSSDSLISLTSILKLVYLFGTIGCIGVGMIFTGLASTTLSSNTATLRNLILRIKKEVIRKIIEDQFETQLMFTGKLHKVMHEQEKKIETLKIESSKKKITIKSELVQPKKNAVYSILLQSVKYGYVKLGMMLLTFAILLGIPVWLDYVSWNQVSIEIERLQIAGNTITNTTIAIFQASIYTYQITEDLLISKKFDEEQRNQLMRQINQTIDDIDNIGIVFGISFVNPQLEDYKHSLLCDGLSGLQATECKNNEYEYSQNVNLMIAMNRIKTYFVDIYLEGYPSEDILRKRQSSFLSKDISVYYTTKKLVEFRDQINSEINQLMDDFEKYWLLFSIGMIFLVVIFYILFYLCLLKGKSNEIHDSGMVYLVLPPSMLVNNIYLKQVLIGNRASLTH